MDVKHDFVLKYPTSELSNFKKYQIKADIKSKSQISIVTVFRGNYQKNCNSQM